MVDNPQFWDGYTKYWDGYGRRSQDPGVTESLQAIMSKQIPNCWDDVAYLKQNRDVKVAVEKGVIQSGWLHFKNNGIKEGRPPCWLSRDALREVVLACKSNYVIATWSGPRRLGNDEYEEDSAVYIKQHIKSLQYYKHALSQITVVVPHNPDEPPEFTAAINSLPEKIQDAKVVVLRRENNGQSYGGYSDVFGQYKSEFTYYFFIEDDYIFVKDDFDLELVKLLEYKRTNNCGYLCSMVTKLDRRPHTAISNGIAKSDTLQSVWDKFGNLPHSKIKEEMTYDCGPQLRFGWAFLEVGTQLQDYLDHFRAPFNDGGKLVIYGNKENPDLLIPIQFMSELGIDL